MFILMSLSHSSPNLQLKTAAFHLFESVRNPNSQWPILAVTARYRIISYIFKVSCLFVFVFEISAPPIYLSMEFV